MYPDNELLGVSGNHTAIFRDIKYTGQTHWRYKITL